MGLRKGQRELIEQYRGGLCAIPAIPGGGKTHCLSLWAVEIIEKGINKPGKILIVTYMNSAVNNFKQRISSELRKRGIYSDKGYFVSTIHGLCLQILKEKPDFISASDQFEIVDELTSQKILNASIDEWKRSNDKKFISYLNDKNLNASGFESIYSKWRNTFTTIISSLIGEFKCRGIHHVNARKIIASELHNSLLNDAADIYAIYNRKLNVGGYIDFNDMLYKAKNILETDENILNRYREKFTFVCEDEAQDSNLIQNQILSLIGNGNLLRVGDSNQAICGSFTNSDFKIFKNFCENNSTVVYKIVESSRNTENIINLANYFVKYIREQHPVDDCRESLLSQFIQPVSKNDEFKNPSIDEYGIKVGIFNSSEDEERRVIDVAQDFINRYPQKTIAILGPDSYKLKDIADVLKNKEIPFEQLDNTSKERNFTLSVLGRVLSYISMPENGENLALMMNECFLLDKYDGINNELGSQRSMLTNFLKNYPIENLIYPMEGDIDFTKIPEDLRKTKIWDDFLSKLSIVRDFLEFPETVVEKLILYISEKLNFGVEERAIAQKVASEVKNLMTESENWRVFDLALELLKPKNKFNHFANVVWELKGYTPKEGVITLTTYHKSKGLEWDMVFLTGINNNNFPVLLNDNFKGEYWYLKDEYRNPLAIAKSDLKKIFENQVLSDSILESKIETISERTRLLYVGITRAREYLYLSGVEVLKGRKGRTSPSRYLIELRNYIREEEKNWLMD